MSDSNYEDMGDMIQKSSASPKKRMMDANASHPEEKEVRILSRQCLAVVLIGASSQQERLQRAQSPQTPNFPPRHRPSSPTPLPSLEPSIGYCRSGGEVLAPPH